MRKPQFNEYRISISSISPHCIDTIAEKLITSVYNGHYGVTIQLGSGYSMYRKRVDEADIAFLIEHEHDVR